MTKTPQARKRAALPRVRRGNAEDAQRMRNAMTDAALALFSEGGLDAVSMRGLSARLCVSAMAPYHYFADKAELLSALWQHVLKDLYAAVSRKPAVLMAARAKVPVSRVHRWIREARRLGKLPPGSGELARVRRREHLIEEVAAVRGLPEQLDEGDDGHDRRAGHGADGDGVDRLLADGVLQLLAEERVDDCSHEGEQRHEPQEVEVDGLSQVRGERFAHVCVIP